MDEYKNTVAGLKKAFIEGKTRNIEWRRRQLNAMMKMLDNERDVIVEALNKDLGKPKAESIISEIIASRNEAVLHLNNLDKWTASEKVSGSIDTMMDTIYTKSEPYGVALIIGAWNYPIQLTFLPLIGAISAGNCVILKPSEVAWETAQVIARLVTKYLDNDVIKVINGGVMETTALLEQHFDLIFYTGNASVGRIVAMAAAKNLTPTILELGGKSPVYVCPTSDLRIAARRIAWGRFINCGQTCIAPDYIMCPIDIQQNLITEIQKTLVEFYGDDIENCPSYGKIVNKRQFDRIKRFIDQVDSNKIAIGGQMNSEKLFISPTVIKNADKDTDLCMLEEIFGPVLSIYPVKNHQEAIDFINKNEKPLSLYIFTKDERVKNGILDNTSAGMICINDTVIQGVVDGIPFGGIGNSGTGAYHGYYTFQAFSHKRGILEKFSGMETVNSLRYPPYSDKKLGYLEMVLKKNPSKKYINKLFFPIMLFFGFISFFWKRLFQ